MLKDYLSLYLYRYKFFHFGVKQIVLMIDI